MRRARRLRVVRSLKARFFVHPGPFGPRVNVLDLARRAPNRDGEISRLNELPLAPRPRELPKEPPQAP